MKDESEKALESLSLYCHIGGIITIFLGLMIIFMTLIEQDFRNIQVGIFIFVTGYAFVKISQRLSEIVLDEKNKQADPFSFK